ncbi:YveK family protein [Pseudalkalibacillus decolorationis]|uniref:YveK family protein n=1 Tax=Pseudalkalibacillus decolorationis TaxID=163879 RepID=UPI002148361B|nr:Wzz/FepE/Etk N-terminal domain-containing protein [Pseudalkalibacillus decolorationis]
MEETISLKDIFETLKKRIALIIMITLIATAASAIISYFFLTPIYQSSTQILVNQSDSEQQQYSTTQIQTSVEMINTYRVIIKSPAILEGVIQELDLNQNVDQLNESISVNSEQNSQVFTVAVQNADPELAVKIANTVAETFQKEIASIMKIDNVSILSNAELPSSPSPIKPNPLLNMAIAMVVGLMVGVGIAFLLEYLDNTIKSEQDIEKLLELPVLGVIAEMDEKQFQQSNTTISKSRVRSETYEA